MSEKLKRNEGGISEAARAIAKYLRTPERTGYGGERGPGIGIIAIPDGELGDAGMEAVRRGVELASRRITGETNGAILTLRNMNAGPGIQRRATLVRASEKDMPGIGAQSAFSVVDEAAMLNDALEKQGPPTGYGNYFDQFSPRYKSEIVPIAPLVKGRSVLQPIVRNDSTLKSISRAPVDDLEKIGGKSVLGKPIAANLPFLGASFLKLAVRNRGETPYEKIDPLLRMIPTSSVEALVGGRVSNIGLVVVNENDRPAKEAEWRKGGLKPIPLVEEGAQYGIDARFNNGVLFANLPTAGYGLKPDSVRPAFRFEFFGRTTLPMIAIDGRKPPAAGKADSPDYQAETSYQSRH